MSRGWVVTTPPDERSILLQRRLMVAAYRSAVAMKANWLHFSSRAIGQNPEGVGCSTLSCADSKTIAELALPYQPTALPRFPKTAMGSSCVCLKYLSALSNGTTATSLSNTSASARPLVSESRRSSRLRSAFSDQHADWVNS